MLLRTLYRKRLTAVVAGAVALTGLIVVGCSSSSPSPAAGERTSTAAPATQPVLASEQQPIGRAELWSITCNRCHNAWSPDQYNAAQWEVIMHHMRLRATLTAQEHRDILEFLKASSKGRGRERHGPELAFRPGVGML